MSGLFYVFLKWSSSNSTSATMHGRYMLCLNSRYDADELFRAMQDLRKAGAGLLFPLLTRQSPQFWCYDSPEGWESVQNFQVRNDLPQFKNTLSSMLLNDLGGRVWPVIPNPVSGPDWVSGGDFFIRNRRQPDLYWYLNDTYINTSTQRRTKFRIQRTTPGKREPTIMIREDKVTIQVIPETITSGVAANNIIFIAVGGPRGNSLQLTNFQREWTFGSLVNKDIGVRWADERGQDQAETAKSLLVYLPHGGGDEWELV